MQLPDVLWRHTTHLISIATTRDLKSSPLPPWTNEKLTQAKQLIPRPGKSAVLATLPPSERHRAALVLSNPTSITFHQALPSFTYLLSAFEARIWSLGQLLDEMYIAFLETGTERTTTSIKDLVTLRLFSETLKKSLPSAYNRSWSNRVSKSIRLAGSGFTIKPRYSSRLLWMVLMIACHRLAWTNIGISAIVTDLGAPSVARGHLTTCTDCFLNDSISSLVESKQEKLSLVAVLSQSAAMLLLKAMAVNEGSVPIRRTNLCRPKYPARSRMLAGSRIKAQKTHGRTGDSQSNKSDKLHPWQLRWTSPLL